MCNPEAKNGFSFVRDRQGDEAAPSLDIPLSLWLSPLVLSTCVHEADGLRHHD